MKVEKEILNQLKLNPEEVFPLAGDASARRFFRLEPFACENKKSAVLIVFPGGTNPAEIDRYIRMAGGLALARIPVPEIYRFDYREGYIVVEDCGNELLQNAIARRTPSPLYRQAVDLIVEMQERVSSVTGRLNPPFNEEKFLGELNFFLTHTLEGYYGAKLGAGDRAEFQNVSLLICRAGLGQARVFCHRDYHSRNLLVQDDSLRIIDFQDGRIGPYTYDLVSLLEDPYAGLEPDIRKEMKEYYLSLRNHKKKNIFFGDFYRDYDMILIQRLLKAAGTFGYMFQEKKKPEYLKYLPVVFRRVDAVLEKYQEYQELRRLLSKYGRY